MLIRPAAAGGRQIRPAWFCMQLYPQSLDNERRLMMSRAFCAGPSVPGGDNEHGALPGQVDPHRSCRVQGDRVMRDYLLASSKLN